MTFAANVVRVLIASPRDTSDLRDTVEQALHQWNGDRSEGAQVILLPRRWETSAVPEVTGSDGQTVINKQLVDSADVVIAIFNTTLGTETPRAASGTAEELGRAHAAGKPVHVYFSSMPLPRDHDRKALAALDAFKEEIGNLSLYGSFDTPGSLREQVRRAIEFDVQALNLDGPRSTQSAGHAALRAEYLFAREPNGRGKLTTTRQRLRVTNDGPQAAEDTYVEMEPLEEGMNAPMVHGTTGPFTIPPLGGVYDMPILLYSGSASSVKVTYKWTENDEPHESSQTVSF